MARSLAVAVAKAPIVEVEGAFYRHTSMSVSATAGSESGGRWGREGAYSVLYLGRPPDSVVVEAYRHLVDDSEGMSGARVKPRRFHEYRVQVGQILDLRTPEAVAMVGLEPKDLITDPREYERCQAVGAAAHQLGLHGVIAPAATGLGETLALFERYLLPEELPEVVLSEVWNGLPAHPRRLRLVRSVES